MKIVLNKDIVVGGDCTKMETFFVGGDCTKTETFFVGGDFSPSSLPHYMYFILSCNIMVFGP